MRIEEKDQVTTIHFPSCTYRETAKTVGLFLLLFPGLLMLWIGTSFDIAGAFWWYTFLFYALAGLGLWWVAGFEKKIEIHPERIYVKSSLFLPEYEYPVKEKMVLFIENYPWIQLVFPREYWRVSVGYPEDNEVFELIEEMNDFHSTKKIAGYLSCKLKLPVVDYTYQDQNEIIMYMAPEEVQLPFAWRVVKFPDLLEVGELPADKSVFEDIISTKKRIYKWSGFTTDSIINACIIAGVAVLTVAFGLVSAEPGALISLTFLVENQILYYLILLALLAHIFFLSGKRKKLELTPENLSYESKFFHFMMDNTEIPISRITEIRVKPCPGGFFLLIISPDKSLSLTTHHRGIANFGHLLWFCSRIQDFLLNNRTPELLSPSQKDVFDLELRKKKKFKKVEVEETSDKTPPEEGKEEVEKEPKDENS